MSSELPTYTTQEEVMFFDTDIGGVVHNLAYLRMVETCRTKLATEKLGMNLKDMADTGLYPVVVRTEVDRSGLLIVASKNLFIIKNPAASGRGI